jgi:carbon storage regulator
MASKFEEVKLAGNSSVFFMGVCLSIVKREAWSRRCVKRPMLIISRKKEQKIMVADNVEITILEIGRNRVRFGIKAPKEVPIQTRKSSTQGVEREVPEVSDSPDLPLVGISPKL